uniref:Uncharacterized protein n=1 Tax=Romanomermis culicivorax TaxID=13658 RepID=A0A915HFW1_ROMCU
MDRTISTAPAQYRATEKVDSWSCDFFLVKLLKREIFVASLLRHPLHNHWKLIDEILPIAFT